SYGGGAGGRHAVLHLENVMSELHAVTIRDGLAGAPAAWCALPRYDDTTATSAARTKPTRWPNWTS
ncbi:hypothetical protein AB0A89_28425, partial [Streptomyces albogriseolus]